MSKVALLSAVLLALLFPGSLPVALLWGSNELGPPLAVLTANALFYSFVAFALLSAWWPDAEPAAIRRATTRLALPTVVLFSLACVPALNPLWPRGMSELTKQESELQAAFPVGEELSHGRSTLQLKGIQFREETKSSGGVVLERNGRSLTAVAGDRVLSARYQTGASEFPCGYDMEIVLVFSQDDKLKQQYVHRLRVCP